MRRAGIWVLLCALFAACAASPGAATTRLRILAYNIKHGHGMDGRIDLDRVAAMIRSLDPDVVTLQEIDNGCGRSGGVDQARALGEACAMESKFGAFMDYDGGRYGMALLSRHPVTASANVRLPPGAEPRSALEARIRVPGSERDVVITGIHFYRSEAERLAQAQTLVDRYAGETAPVVLAGDFNSERGDRVMRLLEETWTNPIKQGDANTFPSDAPDSEIDFILVRAAGGFRVLRHVVVPEPVVSDHRPIVIDLELR